MNNELEALYQVLKDAQTMTNGIKEDLMAKYSVLTDMSLDPSSVYLYTEGWVASAHRWNDYDITISVRNCGDIPNTDEGLMKMMKERRSEKKEIEKLIKYVLKHFCEI